LFSVERRMATTLYRPVGLAELALIWDSGMREFPPRLPDQPIFYPVANAEYASKIARDWNTRDERSGFAGYVTRFVVNDAYLAGYEPHVVGSGTHVEYWIPAEQLKSFNQAIEGPIQIQAAFFGSAFAGYVPEKFGLRGKDAKQQFVILGKTWDYSRMDFVCEISANRKAVYCNWPFWLQCDFSSLGVDQNTKTNVLATIRTAWDFNHIEVSLEDIAADSRESPRIP
jgi:hypothetical protein